MLFFIVKIELGEENYRKRLLMTDIKIRLASTQEIDWINKKYDEIGFLHPEFNREKIAITEKENQKVGCF